MLYKAHYTACKLGAIALVGFLLAGNSTAAQAGDHRHDRPECRQIIKKIQIGDITYTERGTACRNDFGGWNMVTPSRYPVETVYFHDGHHTVPLNDFYNRGYGHQGYNYDRNDDRHHHGSERHGKRCKH